MEDFARQLQDWRSFYASVATASASLTGLLFVSLSLRRQGDKAELAKGSLHAAELRGFPLRPDARIGLPGAPSGSGRSGDRSASPGSLPRARLAPPGGAHASTCGEPRLRSGYAARGRPSCPGNLGLFVVPIEVLRGGVHPLIDLVLVIAALLTTGSWHAWMLQVEPPA